ncbi:MAG: phosphatidic acid phosphatase, partial [Candidatus Poribacteria bacterium]|nr:phosphatidic acid phosphatase [Candidatus Poribacteria bacterium]
MFQTEIIIFLQSYSNDHLNTFFQLITSLGYSSFIYPFFIVIIFGINYRIGFILLYLAIWNGISTDLLKNLFELPRPSNVDSAVQLLGKDYLNPTFLTGMGAESFFGLL